ncbi:hypothetical protein UAJ10_29065 [Nitrospirillum sp. BR 11164]|uniref:hypothetical protein n=1 Tax=Nitrospirillum sp. BR 11164 TaxID=3104324 RepID=UPI002B00319D|nr:hypothetical protein [Nitrospirillum sp. BR 11164]MEA1653053.1 hypothetical protein [Nitrospirillum sp. BR 11164]
MNLLFPHATAVAMPSPVLAAAPVLGGELAGLSLIAYAMGCAARRDGHALLSNPFDEADALGSLGHIEPAGAWRDGWLNGG